MTCELRTLFCESPEVRAAIDSYPGVVGSTFYALGHYRIVGIRGGRPNRDLLFDSAESGIQRWAHGSTGNRDNNCSIYALYWQMQDLYGLPPLVRPCAVSDHMLRMKANIRLFVRLFKRIAADSNLLNLILARIPEWEYSERQLRAWIVGENSQAKFLL